MANRPQSSGKAKSAIRLREMKVSQKTLFCNGTFRWPRSLRLHGDEVLAGIEAVAAALLDDLEGHDGLDLVVALRGDGEHVRSEERRVGKECRL